MKASLAIAVVALGLAVSGCGEDDVSAPAYTPLVFDAELEATTAAPTTLGAVRPTGTGSFAFTTGISPFFDPGSDERKIVTYSVNVGDLSGRAVQAHIHGPAGAGATGDVLVPLTVTSTDTVGLIIRGTFTATTNPAVSMDSLLSLFNRGNAYVDIHTAAFPNGEIRGQISGR